MSGKAEESGSDPFVHTRLVPPFLETAIPVGTCMTEFKGLYRKLRRFHKRNPRFQSVQKTVRRDNWRWQLRRMIFGYSWTIIRLAKKIWNANYWHMTLFRGRRLRRYDSCKLRRARYRINLDCLRRPVRRWWDVMVRKRRYRWGIWESG